MEIKDLQKHLIENSPFKFKGDSKDLFYFEENTYCINDGKEIPFTITKQGENFNFSEDLIPVFMNVKIEIPGIDGFPVIINYDSQKLRNHSYRNKDAESGYLILKPFNSNISLS